MSDPQLSAQGTSTRLGRSGLVVGGATLISRILGFVRDVVLARWLGASAMMDVFIVALQIPNFFRRLFAEGAFNHAFIPVLAEHKAQHARAEVRQLHGKIMGTLGGFLLGFVVLSMLAAPLFVYVFSSGFAANAEQFELAVNTLRITFPYLLFISLAACAAGVLNTYGHFFAPAIAPVILNVSIIAAALWGLTQQHTGLALIALAVSSAGLLQWIWQWPFLWRRKLLAWPVWAWRDPAVKKVRRLMLPALISVSAVQISLIVDRHIASYLQEGSISWLFYADRLMEFPLGIYVIALSTVLLPSLSAAATSQRAQAFEQILGWGAKVTWLLILPAAMGLFMLAEPILATLFQAGEFDRYDVHMTGLSLQAYAFALLGFAGVKVFAPAYFAKQDMKTPVRASVMAVMINIVLNLLLVGLMLRYGSVAPHLGLAIATACAVWFNAFWLWWKLPQRLRVNVSILFKSVLACLAMIAVLWGYRNYIGDWSMLSMSTRWVQTFIAVSLGGLTYLGCLWVLGEPCQQWFANSPTALGDKDA